jgi:hypothetical protein
MQTYWKPVMDAEDSGGLDIGDIREQDRSAWLGGQVRVVR